MKFTIIIPHYQTGKMTVFSIAQFLKFKGKHELKIIVVDNNSGDGSIEYLKPFHSEIEIVNYPKGILQSHGIAIDHVLPGVATEYFITAETDSFPTKDGWLDYYEALVNEEVDAAGSLLSLSGGTYLHPCGAMYKKSTWEEAHKYISKVPYYYFPAMALVGGHPSHLMVHKDFINDFMDAPEDYIELYKDYIPFDDIAALGTAFKYKPVNCVFHYGMGSTNESYGSYGRRSIITYCKDTLIDGKKKIIKRVGMEPGQWFSYWMAANNKRLKFIPTSVKWLDNKEGGQQEHTITEVGFMHLWGITAWKDSDPKNPIAKLKQGLPEGLYETLPEHQKIH